MRKLLILSMFLTLGVIQHSGILSAEMTRSPNGITVGSQAQETDNMTITSGDGQLFVNGEIECYTGIILLPEYFSDVPTADTDAVKNSGAIAVATARAGKFYGLSDLTQPTYPRPITFRVDYLLGKTTAFVYTVVTATGTDIRGTYLSEVLSDPFAIGEAIFSSNTLTTQACFATLGGFTVKAGTTSTPSTDQLWYDVGFSSQVGLSNDLVAATDIVRVKEATAITTTYRTDIIYNKMSFVTAPDGSNDYTVWYKVRKK
jgi:hypothetical protein